MRRSTIFWGAILILAGIVFLLSNLGILSVDIWGLLWPIFLIALGIWILWGTFFRGSAEMEAASLALEDARRARIQFRHGAGRLSVSGGAQPGNLLDGEFNGGIDLNPRRQGDLLDATLSVPVQVFPIFWSPGYNLNWKVALSSQIPISLQFDTGAGESLIDLSELLVTDLRLHSGASSTEITMPAQAGVTRAKIETGAAAVRIQIPEGVGARIRAGGGLASIRVSSTRFPRQGNYYVSPDFDTAENKVDLEIETGVGSVEVY